MGMMGLIWVGYMSDLAVYILRPDTTMPRRKKNARTHAYGVRVQM